MTNSIYSETPENPASYRDKLVGDGKKFKTDEDLARGKIEADEFIERLQRENQEMRQDLQTRATLEQLIEKQGQLKKNDASIEQPIIPAPERLETSPNKPAVTAEQIAAIVKKTMTDEQRQNTATQNINYCVDELKKLWGPSYVQKLVSVGEELGLDQAYMDNLAKTSPKALLALVGEKKQASEESTRLPQSTQRTTIQNTYQKTGEKDWQYYTDLRRTKPGEYYSPRIQNEIERRVMKGELVVPSSD